MSERKNRRRVAIISEFMTKNPCTTAHDLSVKDAQERMFMNKIRHLLVMREGKLAGVVSTRDLDVLTASRGFNPEKTMVSSVMAEHPATCAPDAPLDEVAQQMEAGRFGCTIIEEDGLPVGIFTTVDALRAIRQMIAGFEVGAEIPPEHEPPEPGERQVRAPRARAGDSLTSGSTKTFSPS